MADEKTIFKLLKANSMQLRQQQIQLNKLIELVCSLTRTSDGYYNVMPFGIKDVVPQGVGAVTVLSSNSLVTTVKSGVMRASSSLRRGLPEARIRDIAIPPSSGLADLCKFLCGGAFFINGSSSFGDAPQRSGVRLYKKIANPMVKIWATLMPM